MNVSELLVSVYRSSLALVDPMKSARSKKVLLTLRMGDYFSIGMLQLQPEDCLLVEGFMNNAASWPEGELTTALLLNPAAQVLVRRKQHWTILRKLFHQINGIAAGADQVALCFHGRRAVDVAHDEMVRMFGAESGELVGRAIIRQGAAGIQIRQHHGFLGLRILAVSAMKWTPQNTITSAEVLAALRDSSRESPMKSAMSWISGSW